MRDIFEFSITIMVMLISFFALLAIILLVPCYYIEKQSCLSYGERVGIKVDYSLVNKCMVEVNGTWRPSKYSLEVK